MGILDVESSIKQNNSKIFKLLFLVNSQAIRDAAYDKFRAHFLNTTYSQLKFTANDFCNVKPSANNVDKIHNESKRSRFVFCLFQSFETYVPHDVEFTHVIIDECHHLMASTYNRMFLKLRQQQSLVQMIGMTATLCHLDDTSGSAYDVHH